MRTVIAAALLLAGCAAEPPKRGTDALVSVPTPESRKTLVVVNSLSKDSLAIGTYYAKRRGIPAANVLVLECPPDEEVPRDVFRSAVQNRVRAAITEAGTIDYIVTTKGIPIRIKETGWSTDGQLVAMDRDIPGLAGPQPELIQKNVSPYFGKNDDFSHAKYGLYLVTRLDGYTVDDCKRLVDHSIEAEANKGPFLLDMAANRTGPGFGELNDLLPVAADVLKAKGLQPLLDREKPFVVPDEPLAGYCSWGSNDNAYKIADYRRLKFLPGAIAETFVSTSGRTFRPTEGGQSLIADLVAQGVTGVKGYVNEPFVFALIRPNILFDRYTSGANLAEAMYAASPILKWKDVVIGDPLCRPYKKR